MSGIRRLGDLAFGDFVASGRRDMLLVFLSLQKTWCSIPLKRSKMESNCRWDAKRNPKTDHHSTLQLMASTDTEGDGKGLS